MTRGELLAALRALASTGDYDRRDPESDHSEADALLLAFIADPEVKEAFDAIRKWYA